MALIAGKTKIGVGLNGFYNNEPSTRCEIYDIKNDKSYQAPSLYFSCMDASVFSTHTHHYIYTKYFNINIKFQRCKIAEYSDLSFIEQKIKIQNISSKLRM